VRFSTGRRGVTARTALSSDAVPTTRPPASERKIRSTDSAVLVRCQAAELEELKKAARTLEQEQQARFPGTRLPVFAFVLSVALERAREINRKRRG
jgi:hypothetical protein